MGDYEKEKTRQDESRSFQGCRAGSMTNGDTIGDVLLPPQTKKTWGGNPPRSKENSVIARRSVIA